MKSQRSFVADTFHVLHYSLDKENYGFLTLALEKIVLILVSHFVLYPSLGLNTSHVHPNHLKLISKAGSKFNYFIMHKQFTLEFKEFYQQLCQLVLRLAELPACVEASRVASLC